MNRREQKIGENRQTRWAISGMVSQHCAPGRLSRDPLPASGFVPPR
jgi:hypothetical protein